MPFSPKILVEKQSIFRKEMVTRTLLERERKRRMLRNGSDRDREAKEGKPNETEVFEFVQLFDGLVEKETIYCMGIPLH